MILILLIAYFVTKSNKWISSKYNLFEFLDFLLSHNDNFAANLKLLIEALYIVLNIVFFGNLNCCSFIVVSCDNSTCKTWLINFKLYIFNLLSAIKTEFELLIITSLNIFCFFVVVIRLDILLNSGFFTIVL